jgi:Flp pilus assembly pilin Flp
MNFINSRLIALRNNTKGQDLLEYALLVALIAVVCAAAVGAAGVEVDKIFDTIKTKLVTPAA